MKKSVAKIGLTKQQITALLITMRKELAVIFTQTAELDKIKDGADRKKRIQEDLAYLIKEGFKADPEDANIYEIFKS